MPTLLTYLGVTIDATGASAPAFEDILFTLTSRFQGIFGSDAYLAPDSQDGQWIAVQASAINDVNASVLAGYNAFSPATAQGAGLASVVKINGLKKLVPTNSAVDVTLIGVAGTTILNGLIGDSFSHQWALPPSVVIPVGGSVTVTATCTTPGAVVAGPGTVTRMLTPTAGWQSVTNAAAATAGAPLESDAQLRVRQSQSTALPSQTVLQAIVAAVRDLTGVTALRPYENDTDTTDANSLPPHSICLVVEGGDDTAIAATIGAKKLGTGTYGSTSVIVIDSAGVPKTINFQRPTVVRTIAAITIKALTGYLSTTGDAVKAAMAGYVNGLSIGDEEYLKRVEVAAGLNNDAAARTFNIVSVQIARFGNSLGTADLPMAFAEIPTLATADITLTVT